MLSKGHLQLQSNGDPCTFFMIGYRKKWKSPCQTTTLVLTAIISINIVSYNKCQSVIINTYI